MGWASKKAMGAEDTKLSSDTWTALRGAQAPVPRTRRRAQECDGGSWRPRWPRTPPGSDRSARPSPTPKARAKNLA